MSKFSAPAPQSAIIVVASSGANRPFEASELIDAGAAAGATDAVRLGPGEFPAGDTIPSTTPTYYGVGSASTSITSNKTKAELYAFSLRCFDLTIVASDGEIVREVLPGIVKVYHADGTETAYSPSADTDTARAAAFSAANAASDATKRIVVGSGTYDFGSNRLHVLAGSLIGAGIDKTIFKSSLSVISETQFTFANGAVIQGLTLDGSAASLGSLAGNYDTSGGVFTGQRFYRCKFIGTAHDVWFFAAPGTATTTYFDECESIGAWDHFSGLVNSATYVRYRNCSFLTTGTASCATLFGGTIDLIGCTVQNGSNTAAAITANTGATINIYGGRVRNTGSSLELQQVDTGVLNVYGAQYSRSKTSGTITDRVAGVNAGTGFLSLIDDASASDIRNTAGASGGIFQSSAGGTGNGFTKFTGPTTSEKTFTLPDADATLLHGTPNGIVKGDGSGATSAAVAGTDYLAPNGNGSALTNLNASQLASGTVSYARLPRFTSYRDNILYSIPYNSVGTGTASANILYGCPIEVTEDWRPNRIVFETTSSPGGGALARLGIYDLSTGALLAESGTVDIASAATKAATISLSSDLRGRYMLFVVTDTSVVMRVTSASEWLLANYGKSAAGFTGTFAIRFQANHSFGALPSTIPTLTLTADTSCFLIGLEKQ